MSKVGPLVIAASLAGCGGAPPPKPVEPIAMTAAPAVDDAPIPAPALPAQKLSRWVPSDVFRDIGEGRRAAVVSGRRIVIDGGEATVLDAQPIDDLGRAAHIPKALGGGWLFLGREHARFATSYEATPRLIAEFSPGDASVGVGHAQLFVKSAGTPAALYALPSGEKLPLPVANVVQVFGAPNGVVAARTEKGDLYASTAKGAPFKKVTSGVEYLAYDGKGIVVQGKNRTEVLDVDGHLAPQPSAPGMTVTHNVDAFQEPWPDFSRPPPKRSPVERLLEPLTVVSGEVALYVDGHDLVALDAKTGEPEKTVKGAFAGHSNCFPIRGGTPAFIGCNDGQEMNLFRVATLDEKPVLERSFPGTYTQDFGEPPPNATLALARACDGKKTPGATCVRKGDGTWTDISKPADPHKLLSKVPFIVHVATSPEGDVYAFGWLGGNGALIVSDTRAKKVRSIDKSTFPKWAADGIRWDSLTVEGGTLRFLLGGKTAGVLEILPDDSVKAQKLSGRMASNHGRALLIGEDGKLRETLDAGLSFHEVTPPPGGAPESGFFRCVETGCSLGPWHRVGWGPD